MWNPISWVAQTLESNLPKLNWLAHIFPVHKFHITLVKKIWQWDFLRRETKRGYLLYEYVVLEHLQQDLDECVLCPKHDCTMRHQHLKLKPNGYFARYYLRLKSVFDLNHHCALKQPAGCPAPGSFPKSRLFASGGQTIGASASASVLPVNIQGWFPLGSTGLDRKSVV